jgi:hypothetical protein
VFAAVDPTEVCGETLRGESWLLGPDPNYRTAAGAERKVRG